jgi:hypothetical protein
MDSRLAKLYDTNEPGIRNLADICDVYINVYSKLKNNIIVTNNALTEWYNGWVVTSDGVTNDQSLNTIFSEHRSFIGGLQNILKNQNTFFNSIKLTRLPNGDTISFTPNVPAGTGARTNQTRDIKARYNLGTIGNLGSDSSSNSVVDIQDLAQDLSSNPYVCRYYYQIGTFTLEKIEIDTKFGTSDVASVSNLYEKILGTNNQDGTSIIEKNTRLIEQLVFSINMVNDLKKMLTYFA